MHLNCNVAVGPRKLRPSGLDCRNSRIPVGATAIETFPAFARVPLCDLPRTQIPASCFTPTTTNVMSSPCAVPLLNLKPHLPPRCVFYRATSSHNLPPPFY